MRHRTFCTWLSALALSGGQAALAADPPQEFWSGRLSNKTKLASLSEPIGTPDTKTGSSPVVSPQKESLDLTENEPEWLQRMDKNDRATLTGGWALQNWSGDTHSLTTAGDHSGQYAPNTYQGGQFQPWNNVSNRQDISSWNGMTAGFPQQMWSQGYTSPNNYFGAEAQAWGNMSQGTLLPNPVSGGWMMWR